MTAHARELALYDEHCAPHRERAEARERARTLSKTETVADQPWLIAVSNTNCERRATQGLEDAGFEVWYPVRIVESKNRWTKRVVQTTVPLYRGYLFARFRTANEWQAMYVVDGIKTVLLNDQRPLTISYDHMMRIMIDADIIARQKPADVMEIGDEVVITKGPFAGLRASLTRIVGWPP